MIVDEFFCMCGFQGFMVGLDNCIAFLKDVLVKFLTHINFDNELVLYLCIVLFSFTHQTRTERNCVLQFVLGGLCQVHF